MPSWPSYPRASHFSSKLAPFDAESHPEVVCAATEWQREPMRVTFHPDRQRRSQLRHRSRLGRSCGRWRRRAGGPLPPRPSQTDDLAAMFANPAPRLRNAYRSPSSHLSSSVSSEGAAFSFGISWQNPLPPRKAREFLCATASVEICVVVPTVLAVAFLIWVFSNFCKEVRQSEKQVVIGLPRKTLVLPATMLLSTPNIHHVGLKHSFD